MNDCNRTKFTYVNLAKADTVILFSLQYSVIAALILGDFDSQIEVKFFHLLSNESCGILFTPFYIILETRKMHTRNAVIMPAIAAIILKSLSSIIYTHVFKSFEYIQYTAQLNLCLLTE